MSNQRYFSLIVDSSKHQSFYLKNDPRLSEASVLFSQSSTDALAKIQDPNLSLAAVFINPLLHSPGALPLIKTLKTIRPATPLYLLHGKEQDLSPLELGRVTAAGSIASPINKETLDKLISTAIFETQPLARTQDTSDPEYISIPASDLLSGCPTRFDIFLRLPSKKYLKISQANEILAIDRVHSYISKGITHFYLKKSSHERCLNYCDALFDILLLSPGISPILKSQETLNLGDRIVQEIRKQGLNEVHFDFIYTFLEHLRLLMKSLPVGSQFDTILENSKNHEHAVSASLIAALISLPLKISTQSLFETVAMSAFLHDIGLYQLPEALQNENNPQLTPDQLALYESHPARSAETLRKFDFVNETVLQAVSQHHQRRNGSGFPKVQNPNAILQVSEIVGLADEIINQPSFNAAAYKEQVSKRFSEPIYLAYCEVFNLL